MDICIGEYEATGMIHNKIAIFNYDHSFFMTPEEIKKKGVPAKLIAPKAFDLSQAERVVITKEELKQRELMEQEKLKNI